MYVGASGETPLATLAVVSNPYITDLPPKEIKDENGRVRDFLAKSGPEGLGKTVQLVNKLKPDAFVVLGSLTWTGSEGEVAMVRRYLDDVQVPLLVTPGHRDRLSGSLGNFQCAFAEENAWNQVKTVNGVSLAFAGDLDKDPDTAVRRLGRQFAEVPKSKGILLFSGLDRSVPRTKLTSAHPAFWKMVDQHNIAVRFDPTRYGNRTSYVNTLPTWSAASSGWSARGAVTLAKVFKGRIELSQVSEPSQRAFTLTIPNPVSAPRLPPADQDPYGCPSYSQDLAAKPEFTFALVSDPQYDREANREYLIQKAGAAIAELNQLKPAMVLVAGDLVNNNLPEEWEMFNEAFSRLEVPRKVYVPGNHDVLFGYDFIESSYSSARTKKPHYATIFDKAMEKAKSEGYIGSTALYEQYTGQKPRQLVEHGNSAFITVPFLTQRADPAQLSYLRQKLEKSRHKDHVFVVAHYPSLPAFGNNLQPTLGGDEVLAMLEEYKVTGYLFGHRHRNGFRMYQNTAHVLTDNMLSIHLFHVFPDRIVIGRKRVGSPLYSKLDVPSPRSNRE